MPNFRFLGFNAGLLMRPQERSKQESLLLDSGGSPSRKIASLSEAPTSLAAGWLEVSACSTPRPPASSTPITIGSNSRHVCNFVPSCGTSKSSRSLDRASYGFSERAHSGLPGQSRNLSEISLPLIQRTGRIPSTDVTRPGRTRQPDQLAADSTTRSKACNPPPSARVSRHKTTKLLSSTVSCTDNNNGQGLLSFSSQSGISRCIPSQSNDPSSRNLAQSLSCLKSIPDSNQKEEADNHWEMLSAAYFLPKLPVLYPLSECSATEGWRGSHDDDAIRSFPDGSQSAGSAKPASSSSLAVASSLEICSIPSPLRDIQDFATMCAKALAWPSDEEVHSSEAYTPTYPEGSRNSQPSPSKYYHSTVSHDTQTIPDPCFPEEYGVPPTTPLICHSPSEGRPSLISISISSQNTSFSAPLSFYPASEPRPHLSEAEPYEMTSDTSGSQAHARFPTYSHSQSLHSRKQKHPSLPRCSTEQRSLPSFSQESRSVSDSTSFLSDDHPRATGLSGFQASLQTQGDMESLSPCQRDMLQIMAVYGKSIFEPLVSTELAVKGDLSPKEELLVHPSEFFSIEKINRDEILSTPRPSQFFLQQPVLFQDASLQSGILFSQKDKFHNLNISLARQEREPDAPTSPHPSVKPDWPPKSNATPKPSTFPKPFASPKFFTSPKLAASLKLSTSPKACASFTLSPKPHTSPRWSTNTPLRRDTPAKKSDPLRRPSTAVPSSPKKRFVRRLSLSASQSSKNKAFREQNEADRTQSQHEIFEALLKAADESHGGTLKLSLSSKIDSLAEASSRPPTLLPRLRLSCDFFSLTPRHSICSETETVDNAHLESK